MLYNSAGEDIISELPWSPLFMTFLLPWRNFLLCNFSSIHIWISSLLHALVKSSGEQSSWVAINGGQWWGLILSLSCYFCFILFQTWNCPSYNKRCLTFLNINKVGLWSKKVCNFQIHLFLLSTHCSFLINPIFLFMGITVLLGGMIYSANFRMSPGYQLPHSSSISAQHSITVKRRLPRHWVSNITLPWTRAVMAWNECHEIM